MKKGCVKFVRVLTVIWLGSGLALTGSAVAQTQRLGCQADVAKFCSHTEQGKGRIAQCLKEVQWQLSTACQQYSELVNSRTKETLQACQDEILQYCSVTEVTNGRITNCLKKGSPNLSAECKALAKLL